MSGVASRLKERVRIERQQQAADGFGGVSINWVEVAHCFAEVVPMSASARERAVADQALPVAGYRVRVRHRNDVDASMRVQWRGRTLAVHAVQWQDDYLELLTYEEQA